jgi:hypothetical protein
VYTHKRERKKEREKKKGKGEERDTYLEVMAHMIAKTWQIQNLQGCQQD